MAICYAVNTHHTIEQTSGIFTMVCLTIAETLWFTNIFPSNRVLKWSRQIHIATSKKIEKTYHYNYNCRILLFPIFFPLFDLEIAALLEKSMRLLDEQIPLEIFMLGFTTCVSSRTPNSKNA